MSEDLELKHSAEIKVLFNKLSELILHSIENPKTANIMIGIIINWAGMMVASIMLMIKAVPAVFVQKVLLLFQDQIRVHAVTLIQELKKKEQSVIKTD